MTNKINANKRGAIFSVYVKQGKTMDFKKSIFIIAGILFSTSMLLAYPSVGDAAGSVYRIALKRINPNQKITRDAVASVVEDRYDGRILSVRASPKPNYPDCHTVSFLRKDGELMTIQVACH